VLTAFPASTQRGAGPGAVAGPKEPAHLRRLLGMHYAHPPASIPHSAAVPAMAIGALSLVTWGAAVVRRTVRPGGGVGSDYEMRIMRAGTALPARARRPPPVGRSSLPGSTKGGLVVGPRRRPQEESPGRSRSPAGDCARAQTADRARAAQTALGLRATADDLPSSSGDEGGAGGEHSPTGTGAGSPRFSPWGDSRLQRTSSEHRRRSSPERGTR
jgi:hypothetical protein